MVTTEAMDWLSPHRVAKLNCFRSEAEAIQFVGSNTSIPLQKIVSIYPAPGDEDLVDIVFKFMPGECLAYAWHDLDLESKKHVLAQLAGFIRQLRELTPPKGENITSTKSGPILDHRLGSRPRGPFSSIAAFHEFIRQGHADSDLGISHKDSCRISYSHADLSPENVIVCKGKIVAIIDWEFAGWWPEYWEYTKIKYGYRPYRSDFYDLLDKMIPNYPDELNTETALWKRFDTFSYDKDLYEFTG
ncbi:MAG: hypothetical protein MMC23_009032 [Stictis urceolatum]|nr:hypothetical protein [Stictis urceolata]